MSYLLFLSLELNLLLLLSDEGDEGRDFDLDRALSTLVGDWGGGGAAASWAGVLGAGAVDQGDPDETDQEALEACKSNKGIANQMQDR